jgi:glycosyltransferase involved in cell wall biosynthesis
MSLFKVTVCVVTFNHARYIRDAIMSVIAQGSDVALEVLVGDDCSDDGTSEIVHQLAQRYPETIRHIRHETRLGRGSLNYHQLWRRATGEFIAHLDGDDFWLPGKLAAQVRFLVDRPDCPAVYTNALVVSDDGRPTGIFNNPQPECFDLSALVCRGNFLNHSSLLYRGDLIGELLKLEPPFLDYRIHLRLARQGAVGYLNQALTGYRMGSSSSAIIHANDLVRELYWQALLDVPSERVTAVTLAGGMAEFVRAAFMRSLRVRSFGLVRKWWPRVVERSPVPTSMLVLLSAWAVLRSIAAETLGVVGGWIARNPGRIIYRR